MAYEFDEIVVRATDDPNGFVETCEGQYEAKLQQAANQIAERIDTCHIVLLSGPSGSGKTTTAKKIQEKLGEMGINSHTVSLDNYFLNVDPETSPRDENGDYDFESPLCLDTGLLVEHFTMLDARKEILVPKFDFKIQGRNMEKAKPLRLGENEVAIFEGIHALNDRITGHGGGRHATKLYISARSDILRDGKVFFKGTWMRILRRVIRDRKFRGASPAVTFGMWNNVRIGEKKYISPFKNTADIILDSSLMYEVPALKPHAEGVFDDIPETTIRYAEVMEMRDALDAFPSIPEDSLPKNSLLREFIGGGTYKY